MSLISFFVLNAWIGKSNIFIYRSTVQKRQKQVGIVLPSMLETTALSSVSLLQRPQKKDEISIYIAFFFASLSSEYLFCSI